MDSRAVSTALMLVLPVNRKDSPALLGAAAAEVASLRVIGPCLLL